MVTVRPETEEALKAGRIRVLVLFDFEFTPMRVHDGDETIEWDGHDWEGLGSVIRINRPDNTPLFSLSSEREDAMAASLPLSDELRDVLANDYYCERRMEMFLCSVDAHGEIIERFRCVSGTIAAMHREGNVVTVIARDDTFDSIQEKDARHVARVESVRARFNRKLMRSAMRDAPSWLMNLIGVMVGSFGGLIFAVLALIRRSKRRALAQRIQARRQKYWVNTEPKIPYKWKWKKGYVFWADTLAEARQALCDEVARKIWRFPRGWLKMTVRISGSGRWVGFIDLDQLRQAKDPERWKATDPLRKWGRKE